MTNSLKLCYYIEVESSNELKMVAKYFVVPKTLHLNALQKKLSVGLIIQKSYLQFKDCQRKCQNSK